MRWWTSVSLWYRRRQAGWYLICRSVVTLRASEFSTLSRYSLAYKRIIPIFSNDLSKDHVQLK